MRCRDCGQHWKVDAGGEMDRHSDHAFKIDIASTWRKFDDKPARAALLIRIHGGESLDRCLHVGCSERSLADMVFCVRHANTGYRL
jgi:hypothetical protein